MSVTANPVRARWRMTILAIILFAFTLIALWGFLLPLAGWAIARAAAMSGYELSLTVKALGTGGARLRDVRLARAITIAQADLDWSLAGLRARHIDRIKIAGASAAIRIKDGKVIMDGLDLGVAKSGPAWTFGALSINDSHLRLALEQGVISADVFARKAAGGGWTFRASAKPSSLKGAGWSGNLAALTLDGDYSDGHLEARIKGALGPGAWARGDDVQTAWQGADFTLSCACDLRDFGGARGTLKAQGTIRGLNASGLTAKTAQVSLALEGRTRRDDPLDALDGQVMLAVRVEHANAAPRLIAKQIEPSAMTPDLAVFAAAFKSALGEAQKDFSSTLNTKIHAKRGVFQTSDAMLALVSAASPKSRLQASAISARFVPKTGAWRLSGRVKGQLGDFATLALDQMVFERADGDALNMSAKAGAGAIQTAGKSLSLKAQNLKGRFGAKERTLEARIDTRWDGPLGGVHMRNAQARGTLRLVGGADGWKALLPVGKLALGAGRITAGDWHADKAKATLRAHAGRPALRLNDKGLVIDAGLSHLAGNLSKTGLEGFEVRMRAKTGTGLLRLGTGAKADGDLSLSSVSVDMPGEQSKYMRIGALNAVAHRRTGSPWRGRGSMRDVRYDSDGMPAHVRARETPFDFLLDKSGLVMRAPKLQFAVSSTDRPAIFPPLRVWLDARLAEGKVIGKGGIYLARDDTYLSDLKLEHDLASSAGVATGKTQSLHFGPHGLDFTELLPSFLGLVANAQGAPAGAFKVKWDASGLGETTGSVDINGMNFDILLGRVENVTGHIEFSSLLPLATKGAARVHVGTLDPGIPLKDGELVFALVEDGGLRIDKAEWPFVGGRLWLKPMLWKIGGVDQKAEVVVDDADMLKLAGLFKFSDLTAQGKLTGSLPLEITDTTIFVHDGLLSAPGPGILRYHSAIGDHASAAAPQAQMTFDVLKNLHFTRLEMRLDGDVGGAMTASMVLVGSNPDVVYGAPFRLNITTTAEFSRLAAQATSGLRIGQSIQRIMENSHLKTPGQ